MVLVRGRALSLLVLTLGSWGPATAASSPRQESPPRAAPAAATTGSLHGRVEFIRDPAAPDRRPSINDLGMPGHRDLPDQHVAVVYLETAPRGAFEEREGPSVVLDQRNESFVPQVLAIPVGTMVQFRNSDRTYHNVFSLSKAKSFDLGRYSPGGSKSVRFDHAGIVRVFCEIHSHMSAFILVFAHRYFAATNAQGEYRIEGLPPGTYTASVWHPVLTSKPRSVRIPENGGEVVLDFPLS